MKDIVKGSVVRYQDSYYRVTAITSTWCNLGSIFGSHIYHKRVSLGQVVEAHDEWYAKWQESDTYKCM